MNESDSSLRNRLPLCHKLIRQHADSLESAQRRIEHAEVIRFLGNPVPIRPIKILAHNDLAIALSDADRSEECVAEFREATRLWPENAGRSIG